MRYMQGMHDVWKEREGKGFEQTLGYYRERDNAFIDKATGTRVDDGRLFNYDSLYMTNKLLKPVMAIY